MPTRVVCVDMPAFISLTLTHSLPWPVVGRPRRSLRVTRYDEHSTVVIRKRVVCVCAKRTVCSAYMQRAQEANEAELMFILLPKEGRRKRDTCVCACRLGVEDWGRGIGKET